MHTSYTLNTFNTFNTSNTFESVLLLSGVLR